MGIELNPPTDATFFYNSQNLGSVSWALVPFDSGDYSVSMTIGSKIQGLSLEVKLLKGFIFTDRTLITSSFIMELMHG